MVVIILVLWAVAFLVTGSLIGFHERPTIAAVCHLIGTSLMVAAFIMHGWVWEGAVLCLVLPFSIRLLVVARRVKHGKKIEPGPMAKFYVAEQVRRASSSRGIAPRRWWL